MLNLRQLLHQTDKKINPLDAEIIIAHVLKKTRAFVLSHPEFEPTKAQMIKINALLRRRALGEPIAYLTNQREFFGLDFYVDKRVLVPRPETELLVEEILNEITKIKSQITNKSQKSNNKCDIMLIDIGTGSGCIPITIAKSRQQFNGFPPLLGEGRGVGYSRHDDTPSSVLPLKGGGNDGMTVIATDISQPALAVARKNARAHGVKIKFLRGNLLSPIIKNLTPDTLHLTPRHIIITANLPYGWKEWKNNCSMATVGLKFEPPQALFTGNHGLQLYEEFFQQVQSLLLLTPYSLLLLIEFDPRQTPRLKKLIKKYLPQASIEIKKDLAGHDRVAKILIN